MYFSTVLADMPYDKKSEEVKKNNCGADYVSNDILNINEKGEYFYQKFKWNNPNYQQK